jgi:YVTN family beta-propeller protein
MGIVKSPLYSGDQNRVIKSMVAQRRELRLLDNSRRGFLKAGLTVGALGLSTRGLAFSPAPTLYEVLCRPSTPTVNVGDPANWPPATTTADAVLFAAGSIWAAVQEVNDAIGRAQGVVQQLDLEGSVLTTTLVGQAPIKMAYANGNIWVTNYSTSTVSVVSTQPGAPQVATITLRGPNPEGIMFDGAYIWIAINGVANSGYPNANSVCRISVDPPFTQNYYPVGNNPDGCAFDGSYVWVTSCYSNDVWVLDRTTGEQVAAIQTGPYPLEIVYDGANMWVGNGSNIGTATGACTNTLGIGQVSKIQASTGRVLGSFSVPGQTNEDAGIRGMLYQENSIWTCNGCLNTVTRFDASSGAVLATYPTGANPRAITFDGVNMWVANSGTNTLTAFNPACI